MGSYASHSGDAVSKHFSVNVTELSASWTKKENEVVLKRISFTLDHVSCDARMCNFVHWFHVNIISLFFVLAECPSTWYYRSSWIRKGQYIYSVII